jgi:hypothetical protein
LSMRRPKLRWWREKRPEKFKAEITSLKTTSDKEIKAVDDGLENLNCECAILYRIQNRARMLRIGDVGYMAWSLVRRRVINYRIDPANESSGYE